MRNNVVPILKFYYLSHIMNESFFSGSTTVVATLIFPRFYFPGVRKIFVCFLMVFRGGWCCLAGRWRGVIRRKLSLVSGFLCVVCGCLCLIGRWLRLISPRLSFVSLTYCVISIKLCHTSQINSLFSCTLCILSSILYYNSSWWSLLISRFSFGCLGIFNDG